MDIFDSIPDSWRDVLAEELSKPYIAALDRYIARQYEIDTVYPPRDAIFAALRNTPFGKVKAVIIGQDPYHEPGQACGLAFCVPESVKRPPSLVNIGKELGHEPDLVSWSQQGVLLMNSTLTVSAHKPLSHRNLGWENFTDAIVRILERKCANLVFILWGAYARKKGRFIDRTRHFVIESVHPSPLSAYNGFFGSKPFSRANEYLRSKGIGEIEW